MTWETGFDALMLGRCIDLGAYFISIIHTKFQKSHVVEFTWARHSRASCWLMMGYQPLTLCRLS